MLRLVPLLAAASATPSPSSPASLPPASMTLEVKAQEGGLFRLVVTNQGDETLRFAADARLLRFEVTPPAPSSPPAKGKAKPPKMVECRLPADFRPSDVRHDRAILLDQGARWEEVVDPALYCFGQKEREALVEGATVVAKLGFPAPAPKGKLAAKLPPPPYLAEPTSSKPTVAPLKEVAAEAVILTTSPQAKPAEAPPRAPSADPRDPGAPKLAITTPSHIDAASSRSLVVSATLRNEGSRPMLVHLRRDQLFFDIEGPTGLFRCGPMEAPRAVARDFFSKLAPAKTRTFRVLLQEVCETGVFARPGLYRVRAGALVTDGGEHAPLGAWSGLALADHPTLVRVRRGERPFYVTPPAMVTEDDTVTSVEDPPPH